jgi:hypothetical protein
MANSIIASLGPLPVVLAGVTCGRFLNCFHPPSIGQLSFLAGGVLGLLGLFWGGTSRGQVWLNRIGGASLLAYIAVVGVIEPLMFIGDSVDVAIAVVWLLPVVFGGVILPVRGCWLTGFGCWAVLFSAAVALGYNVSHWGSGIGCLMRWLE